MKNSQITVDRVLNFLKEDCQYAKERINELKLDLCKEQAKWFPKKSTIETINKNIEYFEAKRSVAEFLYWRINYNCI